MISDWSCIHRFLSCIGWTVTFSRFPFLLWSYLGSWIRDANVVDCTDPGEVSVFKLYSICLLLCFLINLCWADCKLLCYGVGMI